jgi:hypothetical protein
MSNEKLTPAEIERLTQLQIDEYAKTNRTGPDTAFSLGDRTDADSAKAHLAAKVEKLRDARSKQAVRDDKDKDHEQER